MASAYYDESTYYEDPSISPTQALFPELSAPYNPNLDVKQNYGHRMSFSPSDTSRLSVGSTSNFRFSSLSPSSAPSLMHAGSSHHSPRSSASPHSNMSQPGDEFFNNSFSSAELDMLLYQDEATAPAKGGLYFPTANVFNTNQSFGTDAGVPSFDDSFDMDLMNLINNSPPVQQPMQQTYQPTFNPSAQQMHPQTIQPQWIKQPSPPVVPQLHVQLQQQQHQQQQQTHAQVQAQHSIPPPQPSIRSESHLKPSLTPAIPSLPQQFIQTARKKVARAREESPEPGKHNKTERRYRQKVQAAQAELRDSVPALRVLYGTSTPEQKATTDFKAADGTVDGLGEIARPNASAKSTIFVGAKMYIELLQARNASLQRKAGELMAWRGSIAGMEDLAAWQADFDQREALLAPVQTMSDLMSDEEEEEEEEEPVARKKARAAPKKGRKSEDMGGVRVFAAFAMSFSLVPSASTLLKHTDVDVSPGHVLSGKVTPTEVIARLPLITAEHTSKLLGRGLPAFMVPHPHTMVDWTWRLLVALVLIVLLGPLLSRWTSDEETGAGDLLQLGKDAFGLWMKTAAEEEVWTTMAARTLGETLVPTALARLHLLVNLHRCKSANALALLALLRQKESIWAEARIALVETDSPALKLVLGLPFDEALRSLELLPKTDDPISAMAEQITLVHLNDLYSRMFIHIVEATKSSPSISSLLTNLESSNLGNLLSTFDREIRTVVEGVPKQSAAHALGLVLIGLWGVFRGPATSAQAALASALAVEEMQGPALESVSAMLELLYPGASMPQNKMSTLPQNALALDKLALVCIQYIQLLSSARSLQSDNKLKRLETSQKVAKQVNQIRQVLTETRFIGMDEGLDDEEGSFEDAKERLVVVLSRIGRRAAGRAMRDDDSGFEGDSSSNEL